MSFQLAKRLFNVDEYYRLAEKGILSDDERVELIHGEIFEKSPKGSRHIACVNRLNSILSKMPDESGILSVQNPISIDEFSEPEPDIAILKFREDFYQNEKPKAQDVLLLIEVCDSSVEADKWIKLPLYAFAGIQEVWLVDLSSDRVTSYTEPKGEEYRNSTQHFKEDTVLSLKLPMLKIPVKKIIWTS